MNGGGGWREAEPCHGGGVPSDVVANAELS